MELNIKIVVFIFLGIKLLDIFGINNLKVKF